MRIIVHSPNGRPTLVCSLPVDQPRSKFGVNHGGHFSEVSAPPPNQSFHGSRWSPNLLSELVLEDDHQPASESGVTVLALVLKIHATKLARLSLPTAVTICPLVMRDAAAHVYNLNPRTR